MGELLRRLLGEEEIGVPDTLSHIGEAGFTVMPYMEHSLQPGHHRQVLVLANSHTDHEGATEGIRLFCLTEEEFESREVAKEPRGRAMKRVCTLYSASTV